MFTYDGLWDVVEWWGERPKTEYNPGFLVYRYRLRRRPGQEKTEILSKAEEKEAHERLRQEEKERRAEERERQSSAVKVRGGPTCQSLHIADLWGSHAAGCC